MGVRLRRNTDTRIETGPLCGPSPKIRCLHRRPISDGALGENSHWLLTWKCLGAKMIIGVDLRMHQRRPEEAAGGPMKYIAATSR